MGLTVRPGALAPRPSAHDSCPPDVAGETWNDGGHESCALGALGARERPAARRGGAAFQRGLFVMFVAMEMSVVVVEKLVPVEAKIKRCSAQLANQIQRASESVALNLAEGRWRSAGDQRRHYEMAAGSASEVTMALRIAVAKRYVSKEDLVEVEGPLDQVRAMLYRLTHR